MAFKGDLKNIGLFDVFQNLLHNRLCGTLRVEAREGERWVAFEEGRIRMLSMGRGTGLPMRGFLVQRNYVDRVALERLLAKRGKSRRLLHDLLARAGLLSVEDFQACVEERIGEELFELLSWKNAQFEFLEGPPPNGIFDMTQKSLPIALDPSGLLMEGARRQDEWERIRTVVTGDHDLFVALGEETPMDSDSTLVWNALDGRSDLAQLYEEVPLGRFELAETIARLVQEGYARPVVPSELPDLARQALDDGDAPRARSLLEKALELQRNNKELREVLAEVLESLGEVKEAAANWAWLASQASQEENDSLALELFLRAADLDPVDIGIWERIYELQESLGDSHDFEVAALDLSRQFELLGLGERAMETLERALDRPDLSLQESLLLRLAETSRSCGRGDEGFGRCLLAAESLDREGCKEEALHLLEGLAQLFPNRKEVEGALEDLRNHRREKRLALRKRLFRVCMVSLLGGSLCLVLVSEMLFRARLGKSLRMLGPNLGKGRALESLGELEALRAGATFSLSGWKLERLKKGVLEAGVAEAEALEQVGLHRAAKAKAKVLLGSLKEINPLRVRLARILSPR
jgi:tetratricopeptide (TPR) repeat protein